MHVLLERQDSLKLLDNNIILIFVYQNIINFLEEFSVSLVVFVKHLIKGFENNNKTSANCLKIDNKTIDSENE